MSNQDLIGEVSTVFHGPLSPLLNYFFHPFLLIHLLGLPLPLTYQGSKMPWLTQCGKQMIVIMPLIQVDRGRLVANPLHLLTPSPRQDSLLEDIAGSGTHGTVIMCGSKVSRSAVLVRCPLRCYHELALCFGHYTCSLCGWHFGWSSKDTVDQSHCSTAGWRSLVHMLMNTGN